MVAASEATELVEQIRGLISARRPDLEHAFRFNQDDSEKIKALSTQYRNRFTRSFPDANRTGNS